MLHVQPRLVKGGFGEMRRLALYLIAPDLPDKVTIWNTTGHEGRGEECSGQSHNQINDGPRSGISYFLSLTRTSFMAKPNLKRTKNHHFTTYPKGTLRWNTW